MNKEVEKKKKVLVKPYRLIYYILIPIFCILVFVLPKELSRKDINRFESSIVLKEDGTISSTNLITFESRRNSEYTFSVNENIEIKNVMVYGENIFGEHKLPYTRTNKGITFKLNQVYYKYKIVYDSQKVISIYDNQIIAELPVINTGKEWVNYLNVEIAYPKDIDKEKTNIYPISLPGNNVTIKENKVKIGAINFPAFLQSNIVLTADKSNFDPKYLENIKESLYTKESLKERQIKGFEDFKKLKSDNNYIGVIYSKYLYTGFLLILAIPITYYILQIINSFKDRKLKYEVKEEFNTKLRLNLIRSFILADKDIMFAKEDIKNFFESVLVKLELEKCIEINKEGVLVFTKTKTKFSKLSKLEKYIMNLMYESAERKSLKNINSKKIKEVVKFKETKKKVLEVLTYTEITKILREESENIFILFKEEIKEEKNKMKKEGLLSLKMSRVDFKFIMVLIPLLIAYTIIGYVDIIVSALIIICIYTLAKISVKLSAEIYTKKGIKLKKELLGYYKYLSSINYINTNSKNPIYLKPLDKKLHIIARIKNVFNKLKLKLDKFLGFEIEKEAEKLRKDQIYSKLFGLCIYKKEKEDKIEILAEAINSYCNFKGIFKE